MKAKNIFAGAMAGVFALSVGLFSAPVFAEGVTQEQEDEVMAAVTYIRGLYSGLVNAHNNAEGAFHANLSAVGEQDIYEPYLAVASDNVMALPIKSIGAKVTADDGIDYEFYTGVAGALEEDLSDSGFIAYEVTGLGMPEFKRGNVVCRIDDGGFACAHFAWYTPTPEWEEFLSGIGAAYKDANEGRLPLVASKTDNNANIPEIKNSDVEPYQNVAVGISNGNGVGGGLAYFYRASETSDWVFFAHVQDVLDCSKYTGDAEKGFAGDVCYEEDGSEGIVGESGVKVPDTGANTLSENGSALAAFTTSTFVVLSALGLGAYLKNRKKGHFVFDKK